MFLIKIAGYLYQRHRLHSYVTLTSVCPSLNTLLFCNMFCAVDMLTWKHTINASQKPVFVSGALLIVCSMQVDAGNPKIFTHKSLLQP